MSVSAIVVTMNCCVLLTQSKYYIMYIALAATRVRGGTLEKTTANSQAGLNSVHLANHRIHQLSTFWKERQVRNVCIYFDMISTLQCRRMYHVSLSYTKRQENKLKTGLSALSFVLQNWRSGRHWQFDGKFNCGWWRISSTTRSGI